MTYTLLGHTLSADVAFPAIALFNLLRFPIIMFPRQITDLINCGVALRRIQTFMEVCAWSIWGAGAAVHGCGRGAMHVQTLYSDSRLPFKGARQEAEAPLIPIACMQAGEVAQAGPDAPLDAGPPEATPVVQASHASFSWDAKCEPLLHDICLEGVGMADSPLSWDSSSSSFGLLDPGAGHVVLKRRDQVILEFQVPSFQPHTTHETHTRSTVNKGQLAIVVGPVGSGKSSLLAALLNEMVRLQVG